MNSELSEFTIFDSKANAYLQPFFSVNRETAIREFTAAVQKDGGQFNKFSEDYSLFEKGTFSHTTGLSEHHSSPVHVVNAVTLKGQPAFHLNGGPPNWQELPLNTEAEIAEAKEA